MIDKIAQHALSSVETLSATEMVCWHAFAGEVPGDFVECGVFAGAQSAVMALVSDSWRRAGTIKRVHLFDSFQGIPQAGPRDLEFLAAGHKPGLSACSLENVIRNMDEWGIDPDLLVYHPGWFADTMPTADIGQIAVLRIDCDLYESTLPVMKYLYPKVAKGGWIIADDYQLSGCRDAIHEVVVPGPIYWRKE